jgi:undecaprenyl-diphosphatase
MASDRSATLVHRLGEIDVLVCRHLNRTSRIRFIRAFFSAISRLGDGVFWYTLIALIAVLNPGPGYVHAVQMLLTAAAGLLIYKLLKSRTVRPRPFTRNVGIEIGAAPLDQYSFPSGHTLHAFSFGLIACAHYPWLYAPLGIFVVLVALSRIILGLHYPTDVLAGAVLGTLLATISLSLFP